MNVPISDALSIWAAGSYASSGHPWFSRVTKSQYGEINTYAGRLTARFQPSDNIDWIMRGDYMKNTGDASGHSTVITASVSPPPRIIYTARLGGVAPDFDNQFSRSDNNFVPSDLDDHQFGLTNDFNLQFGCDFSLRLINGYRDWSSRHQFADLAFTPRPIFLRDEPQAAIAQSHELQISSPIDQLLGGRLSFVVGLRFFKEHLRFNENFSLRPTAAISLSA